MIKYKAGDFLANYVDSNRDDLLKLQQQGIAIWPHLLPDFRQAVLEKATSYAPLLVSLDPDEVVGVIFECLPGENGFEHSWVKLNVVVIQEDLKTLL